MLWLATTETVRFDWQSHRIRRRSLCFAEYTNSECSIKVVFDYLSFEQREAESRNFFPTNKEYVCIFLLPVFRFCFGVSFWSCFDHKEKREGKKDFQRSCDFNISDCGSPRHLATVLFILELIKYKSDDCDHDRNQNESQESKSKVFQYLLLQFFILSESIFKDSVLFFPESARIALLLLNLLFHVAKYYEIMTSL